MIKTLTACLLLMSTPCVAGSNIETAISGFISGTLVSDPDFYEHTARGGLNIDISKGSYLLHTQLASSVEFPTESLVSRLTLEKVFHIAQGQEMSLVIGRYPRLFSFFNAITDAVGTSGLAMLPLSQYKRRYVTDSRMISGDGVMVNYRYHEEDYSIEFTADVNQMSKANSCLIHMEFYNKPCGNLGYGYTSDNPNFDFGLQFDSATLRVLAAVTFIDIKSELKNPKDPLALATYTLANSWSHRLYKLGVIKTIDDFWIQAEATVRDIKKAEINKELEDYNVQLGGYLIGGYHFSTALNGYLGYSGSRSKNGSRFDLDDYFVGATYAAGDGLTYSLEYHNGKGRDWNRYLSPDDSWSSAVLSVTWQF
jgi:hypothetical protein